MKKKFNIFLSIIVLLFVGHSRLPQYKHKAIAINIEVPVRVFKGDKFVDNLTIDDFELYEEGFLQKIEAVYLIKKTTVAREETPEPKEVRPKKFSPPTSRHIMLIFELTEYFPRIKEVVEYLFQDIVTAEDSLIVITPVKTYNFRQEALQLMPREMIAVQLLSRIKKDLIWGNREYRRLYNDIERMCSDPLDPYDHTWMMRYLMLVEKLIQLRYLDERKLKEFADYLQHREGQKYVFLFYQEELIPTNSEVMESVETELAHMSLGMVNVEKIKQIFSHSSISINFIYLSRKMPENMSVEALNPVSLKIVARPLDEVFTVFKSMADATGGLVQTSANITSAFKQAAASSENYYLLYYSPMNKVSDGKFRQIKVRVKRKGCRVTHRIGYFADW